MQIELCFNIPANGAVVSAPDWRKRLASVGDGVLPHWFFGREADGATSSAFPKIRFLGGRRALRIVAFGEETSEALSGLMPVLFKLVNRAAETTVPVRMNEHTAAARPSYQRLYHVAAPMLTRRGDRRGRYANEANTEARNGHVRSRIVHGLARQAAFFGLDFPPDDEIDLVECGDYRAKRIHEGFAYGVQYAVIGMPVNLQGIWQTGLVLSHGHGAVTPYRRPAVESEAA